MTPPFKGYRGVTEGEPSPPTIFNVVVDAVMRNWVMVVVTTEAGAEGIRETIQELVDFFYADDGLVALPQTERLQREFNVLIDIFHLIGIWKNVWKMVIMN